MGKSWQKTSNNLKLLIVKLISQYIIQSDRSCYQLYNTGVICAIIHTNALWVLVAASLYCRYLMFSFEYLWKQCNHRENRMQWEQRGNIYFVFCIKTYSCPVSGSQAVWRYSTGDGGSKRFCNAFLSSKAKSTQHVLSLIFQMTKPISHKAIKHPILWHDIYLVKEDFSRRVPFICNVSVSSLCKGGLIYSISEFFWNI